MVDIQVKNLTKFFTIGENLLEGLYINHCLAPMLVSNLPN